MNCVVLETPLNDGDVVDYDAGSWLVFMVNYDSLSFRSNKVAKHVTVFLCNRKTLAVIYWPDIYSQSRNALVTSLVSFDELEVVSEKTLSKKQTRQSKQAIDLNGLNIFNSVIAFAVPNYTLVGVAPVCSSSGEFWLFECSPTGIFNDYSSVGYLFLFKKDKAIILQTDWVMIGNGPIFCYVMM